ncbi:MAG TPA: alanine--glyoxylate aminotransferase family protein [Candidatus Limnocylindrales bacterium]|nr:alanine--glyoxylate aminotransferase family protein [Candidatus Limnocylindrales bacterium]
MNRFETNLRIPGPTSLPSAVREAGSRQMINHRGPEFASMLGRISTGLRPFFGTSNDVLLLSCAGTGGLEAAVVNTLSPGDAVLAVSIGSFGDRFAKIASTYGASVTKLDVEWGRAADPEDVRRALRDAPSGGYRAILLTHNETSTGVMNPLAALAAVVHEDAPQTLVLVDGVSGLGAVAFEQDAWGLDVVVSGSQKAWMVAPGMAFASLGERAWQAAETARMPRFYLDLRAARKSAASGETPWTPAVGVVFQLDVAVGLMAAEGADAIFTRHAACAAATRAGLEALGFQLFAEPAHRSNTVTAAWIPEGLDWKAFNADLKRRKLVLAGGQGQLAGKILRVGHLGTVTLDEILGAIGVLEEVSLLHGRDVVPGTGVAAAQRAGVEVLGVADRAVARA